MSHHHQKHHRKDDHKKDERQKKTVALLFGGLSAERAVSLSTGQAFAKALDELGYPYEMIDAGPQLPLDLMRLQPDVALLALHGKYAEDGTVQGLCEYLKIPYSGSGVMSSALCMNKFYTKQILRFHDLPTAEFQMYFAQQNQDVLHEPQCAIEYPLVVKPSREGSTFGISIISKSSELPAALQLAMQYDKEILLEKYIAGTELTVAILDEKALTPIEIVPKKGFYDYKNKYTSGQTDYILPPRLPDELIKKCQKLALRAHQALQCRLYSRVDFRVTPQGEPYILEINTLPGCTPTSLLPKAAAHDGLAFQDVVRLLVEKAGLDYEGVR